MHRYALLLRAGGNRVYGESAFGLAEAELGALDRGCLGGCVVRAERATIGGVDYLVVETSAPFDSGQVAVLANLSSLHAAFEVGPDGRFDPLAIAPRMTVDDDIVTIQRYAGKTNESFTHLLVNVALAHSGDAFARLLAGERLRLLDPVCGRGTTLNRAVLYGIDAVGVDLDQRDVDEFAAFFTTWLKDKRMKHRAERARLRKGRTTPADRVVVTYGDGTECGGPRRVEVIRDDTAAVRDHVRSRSVDLLVADLPYGVQHGSRAAAGLGRTPAGLLQAALPAWLDVLRPGAAAVLAWNRRSLAGPELRELLTDAGFALPPSDDDAFVHRVDRAILRDVVVAVRPVAEN